MKELLESGKVVPVIDGCYPLSKTPEAFRYFEKVHAKGKVVITMEQNHKNTRREMKRIFTFTINLDGTDSLLIALTGPELLNPLRRTCLRRICPILPRSIASRMGTNSKFALLPMAAKTAYVFFRMAAPVTSGPISGESVASQHKKAPHLP